jgi:hypothetical protein
MVDVKHGIVRCSLLQPCRHAAWVLAPTLSPLLTVHDCMLTFVPPTVTAF